MVVMDKLNFEGPYADLCTQYICYKRSLGYGYDITQCYAVKKMNDYLSECYPGKICLTKKIAEDYILRRDDETPRTQSIREFYMRQFAIYLSSLGYEAYILPSRKKKSTKTFTPYIFTREQIDSIIKAADQLVYAHQAPNSYLVYPMLMRLLYGCGLRISEALRLKMCDVDWDSGILTIEQSKFNNSRLVPMSESLLQCFLTYVEKMKFHIGYDGYLFPVTKDAAYKPVSVYNRFRSFLKQAGIEHAGRGNGPRLHDVRHTFICHALDNMVKRGIDIYCALPILSTYMGHRTVESTEKYLRLVPAAHMDIINSLSPLYEGLFPEVYTDEEI